MSASIAAARRRDLDIACVLCSPVLFDQLARRFEKKLGFRERSQFYFENTLIVKDKKGITGRRDFDLVCRKPDLRIITN